jgi:pimeloyl-ACP methyl ester carboxylesterase
MAIQQTISERGGAYVSANGIDIHYVEAGTGTPLVLLHGLFVSTGPRWAGFPVAYVDHMATLAQHFHVIAPDARGAGLTRPGAGTASAAVLADDVLALIEALDLGRPLLCGFSDGGITATILSIRYPDAVGAVVNHAGFDVFNPRAHIFEMGRMMFGGSPDATEADPDAFERNFTSSPELRPVFETFRADVDEAQGEGYWRTFVADTFPRLTNSPGYTFDDFGAVTAPTLILDGDRDTFCSVEDAVAAYRGLADAELAVLPNHDHFISPAAVAASIDFLTRHQ